MDVATTTVAANSVERELRLAADQIAARVAPERGPVTELIRMHSRYHSTYPVEELSIGFADGSSLQVVFKDLCPPSRGQANASPTPSPRSIRPGFLCDSRREIAVYRSILQPNEISAPRFYGAVEDESQRRYWLFLEEIQGRHLWQYPFEPWPDVARWVAAMHRTFEERAAELSSAAPLLRYDQEFFALWVMRAAEYRPALRPLMAGYERVVAHLSALPLTFVHGEFYASNVLMQESPWGLLVRPVDWEMAGIGTGLLDLAALVAGNWADGQRDALIGAYFEVYSKRPDPPAYEQFLQDLDHARLHLAVQWLGWSQTWTPPREHAQDWLAEANALAKKLGVL